jgi:hypothetical protein
MRNKYTILVPKPEGKRLFIGPMRKWEDNIKMYPMKTSYEDVD